MSTNVEGGRAVARFRLLGFPVHVDISFVLLVAFLGWLSWSGLPSGDLVGAVALWTVVAVVAVLLHELGHAVVARTTGAHPSITLAGLGGLTTFVPPRPMSRGRSIAVSLAGPLVGIVAGGLLLLLHPVVQPDRSLWLYVLYQSATFTTLGWSLLNLLPILPLDGGQAVRELLPGDPAVRERRAAIVSIVVAGVAAVAAFALGQTFLAVFLAFFALSNGATLRRPPRTIDDLSPEQRVVAWLWQGQPERARAELEALPQGTVRDLAVHGAVLATSGDASQGLALLAQEEARRPQDADVAALVALTALLRRDWPALLAQVEGPRRQWLPAAVVERAAQVAQAEGRGDVTARLRASDRPWTAPSGDQD